MKPGAVLEVSSFTFPFTSANSTQIIVEDLIFPSPSALIQKPKLASTIPSLGHLHSLEMFKSKSPTFSDQSSTSPPRSPISPLASLSSLMDPINRFRRSSVFLPSIQVEEEDTSPYPTSGPSPASTESNLESEHPQDHTRLKISWDAMLAGRFLSPKVVAVIPFYLTASFVDTKSYAPLVISLPPNSGNIPSLRSYQSLGSLHPYHRERLPSNNLFDIEFELDFDVASFSSLSNKADGRSFRSSIRYTPQTSAWGPVHMLKSISTIGGCKEAIWEEYKKLYHDDAMSILMRTAPLEEEHETQVPKYLTRMAFEVDWRNWE